MLNMRITQTTYNTLHGMFKRKSKKATQLNTKTYEDSMSNATLNAYKKPTHIAHDKNFQFY